VPSAEKVETVESLKQRLAGARTAVLTEYRGLSVRQLSDLRRELKKGAAGEYRVVKNRLARLAVAGSPLAPLAPHLKGPTGVALTREDPVGVARVLQGFTRANPALTIKAGLVDGQVLGPEQIRALAELPSREALRAQLVGAVQGPLAQLVTLLTAVHGELVRVLEARSTQEAGAASEADPSGETTNHGG
jgi:large subunit ribosomal protein L10